MKKKTRSIRFLMGDKTSYFEVGQFLLNGTEETKIKVTKIEAKGASAIVHFSNGDVMTYVGYPYSLAN